MRLEKLLAQITMVKIERPPEIWETSADETAVVALVGEIFGATLAAGAQMSSLTLNVSNVVVEPDEDEEMTAPQPGEYVALSVRAPTDFGPDATWHPSAPDAGGMLFQLREHLQNADGRFAYVRRIPPQGSITVFLPRLAAGNNS